MKKAILTILILLSPIYMILQGIWEWITGKDSDDNDDEYTIGGDDENNTK